MRKYALIILLFSLPLVLFACDDDPEEEIEDPTFDRLEINGRSPLDDDNELAPYTVEKNETLEVEIFLDNPSDLDINLVRMHNRTFRASAFEDESENDHIVFELRVGSIPGEQSYTLDEIEYLHEGGVGTLSIEEGNEYKLNILEDEPEASLQDIAATTDTIEFFVDVDDLDGVLQEGRVELHDADGLVESRDLETGMGSFEGLYSDHTYTLYIYGDYELSDEEGLREEVRFFESDEITTQTNAAPTAEIINLEAGETDAAFDVDFTDADSVLLEDGLKARLLQEGTLEETIVLDPDDLEAIHLDGLYVNTEYTLEIVADYDLNDLTGERLEEELASSTFTTLEPDLAEIEVTPQDASEDSLQFHIDWTALEDAIEEGSAAAYFFDADAFEEHGTEADPLKVVKLDSKDTTLDVEGFLADQEIKLLIKGDVHIEDGSDAPTRYTLHELTARTDANTPPEASVSNVTLTQTTVEYEVSLSDTDDTLMGLRAYLYEDDGESFEEIDSMELEAGGEHAFEDIDVFSDRSYTVKLSIDYDLRDGDYDPDAGYERIDQASARGTLIDKAPEGTFESIDASGPGLQHSLSVKYIVHDNDDALIEDGLTLDVFKGDEHIGHKTLDNPEGTVTLDESTLGAPIEADSTYTVELNAQYRRADDRPIQTETLAEETLTTEGFPEVEMELLEATVDSLEFYVDLEDGQDNIDPANLEFRIVDVDDEQNVVDTFEPDDFRFTTTFEDLFSDRDYEVQLLWKAGNNENNVNNENNAITSYKLATLDAATLARSLPTVEIADVEPQLGGFDVSIDVDDPDNTGESFTLVAVDEAGNESETVIEGGGATIEGLEPDATYTLRIEATIDYQDGGDLVTYTLASMDVDAPDGMPEVTLTDVETTTVSIFATLDLDDRYDNVDPDSLTLEFLDADGDTLYTESVEDGSRMRFFELLSDYAYTFTLSGEVDANGDGDYETHELLETSVATDAKTLPVPDILQWSVEGGDVVVELSDIDDVDNVFVEDDMRLVLYDVDDGDSEVDAVDLDLENTGGEYVFEDAYESDGHYRLAIEASYDLNDGEGLQEDQTLEEFTFIIRP